MQTSLRVSHFVAAGGNKQGTILLLCVASVSIPLRMIFLIGFEVAHIHIYPFPLTNLIL